MAWSYAVTGNGVVGADRIIYGTYTDAQTSGTQTISTGFGTIKACGTTNGTAARDCAVVISAGNMSLTAATNDDDGTWWAIGK